MHWQHDVTENNHSGCRRRCRNHSITESITEPEIKVFPVSAAILLLPVVGRCSNYLETLFWAKTYNLSFELIILIIR